MKTIDIKDTGEINNLLCAALTAVEVAFKAGYHCQWIKSEQRYIFDPLMKPGDPDGAFDAWLATTE